MACFLAQFSLPTLLSSPTQKKFLQSSQTKQRPQCLPRPTLGLPKLHSVRSMANEAGPNKNVLPRSVPVRVAHELLLAGHRYLDVRTVDEFSAGHPVGATNIPYMFKVGSGMTKNPKFLEEVASVFGKDDEIIIGCQIGKRSFMAAADLLSAGFTGVTNIAGGYSSWEQNGLPTHQ